MAGKTRLNALLAWLLTAWTAVVTTRYVLTILKSLQHPYIPGDEVFFVIVWLSAAVLILCSLAIHQNAATAVWTILIGCTAIAIPLLSGTWIAALIVLWISFLLVLIGGSILRALHLEVPKHTADWLAIAFPLGFATVAFLTFGLALTRSLTTTTAWTLLAVLTLAELKSGVAVVRDICNRLPKLELRKPNLETRALLLLMAFAFTVNLTWSVAPEVQFDALNYHLPVPKLYLAAHGVVDLPYFFHSYFAHLAEMFFAFCMALHSETAVKLLTAVVGLFSIVAIYSLGRTIFSPRIGLWAAAFFYTTPLVSWLTGTAHTDLLLTLFVTAALIAVLKWNRTEHTRWISCAGLLAGSAVAVKLNAMYAVIGITVAVAVAVLLIRSKTRSAKLVWTSLAFGVAAALVALPWYLLTYAHTGNPVFPMLNGIFKSPLREPVNTLMNAAEFGVGKNLVAFSRLPFRLSLDTSRFGEALPAGALGPMLLFVIPFGLIALVESSEARIVGAVAAIYLFLWAETFQYGRYFLVILPIIAIVALAGVESASKQRFAQIVHWSALMIVLILQLTVLSIRYWNVRDRFPIEFAFGMESRESFLSRGLGGFGATERVNQSIVPGHKVLGVDTEYLRFYLEAPLETLAESPITSELRTMGDTPPGQELSRRLSRMNISYILTSTAALAKPLPYYPYLNEEFLRNYASLAYADELVALYKLNTLPDTRQP